MEEIIGDDVQEQQEEVKNENCRDPMFFLSLDNNDDDYAKFKERKSTIMKNIEVISKKKNEDPLKQQEIMASVVPEA